jgi:single-stranded-DNA-specific exonuclease
MKWVLAEHDAAAVSRLAKEAGVPPLIARLMAARGITGGVEARAFLENGLSSLSGPEVFRGMDRAVLRVRDALSRREKIVVYGDYDVDGVTGSAVLWLVLRELGADVEAYIPDRLSEGYGLNEAAIRRIAASGVRVLITVDCGITAVREALVARDAGIDLIVTDHHEFDGGLPEALAVLHPSLPAENVPEGTKERIAGLTGAGMAFKLAQGLLAVGAGDPRLAQFLDLVTLGTVADLGRVTGENRVLVKQGLELLSSDGEAMRPGIAALKEVAGLSGKRVTVGTVGFTLAPRINASGRLNRADSAFRLLTTDDREEASTLAAALDAVNRDRQALEERIGGEARELCLPADLGSTGAFVLASQEWHPGVIGIVASRIVDEFYRPALLIAVKDGVGKGSGRSIPGFDLYHGLTQCADLLLGFGGHKCAAGLSVAEENIPLLRERLSKIVLEQFRADGFVRKLAIDAPITLAELTFDLLREIERLAPFGQGNPEPRLGAKGMEVISLRAVGNDRHMKMRLRQQNGTCFDAIAYKQGESLGSTLRTGSRVAAVFVPRFNTWSGNTSIQLEIKDIKVERP